MKDFVVHIPQRSSSPKSHAWNGGRQLCGRYVNVRVPDHPRANARGCVSEHTLIAEATIGRYLPAGVQVHHVDNNGRNNARRNLVICQNQSYHKLLHTRADAFKACGDANARRCRFCKCYDIPNNLYIGRNSAHHRKCWNKWQRNRYAKKSNGSVSHG